MDNSSTNGTDTQVVACVEENLHWWHRVHREHPASLSGGVAALLLLCLLAWCLIGCTCYNLSSRNRHRGLGATPHAVARARRETRPLLPAV